MHFSQIAKEFKKLVVWGIWNMAPLSFSEEAWLCKYVLNRRSLVGSEHMNASSLPQNRRIHKHDTISVQGSSGVLRGQEPSSIPETPVLG